MIVLPDINDCRDTGDYQKVLICLLQSPGKAARNRIDRWYKQVIKMSGILCGSAHRTFLSHSVQYN